MADGGEDEDPSVRLYIERPQRLHVRRSQRPHAEAPRMSKTPRHDSEELQQPNDEYVFVQKKNHGRRKSGRQFPEPKRNSNYTAEQDNDDLLNDYFDGTPMRIGDHNARIHEDSEFFLQSRPSAAQYPPGHPLNAPHQDPARPPPPPPPPPPTGRPPAPPPDSDDDHVLFNTYRRKRPLRHGHTPYQVAPFRTEIWDRAAIPARSNGNLRLGLKLVLTRHGERYTSKSFMYEKGAWDDVIFAHRLKQEYRMLKTKEIGFLQKMTSYKIISFVYFLQFRAFPDPDERFLSGRWEISDRKPITPNDTQLARSSFMYQLKAKSRSHSSLFSTSTGTPKEPDKKITKNWVSRLDDLVEPGAVIDLEIKETFDSMKIYLGLLLGILLSLGVALGYGFAMDNDFSTGFSMASWLITALGFFIAVVSAGEYLGLDSPRATLLDADELATGRTLHPDLDGLRPTHNPFR